MYRVIMDASFGDVDAEENEKAADEERGREDFME